MTFKLELTLVASTMEVAKIFVSTTDRTPRVDVSTESSTPTENLAGVRFYDKILRLIYYKVSSNSGIMN